MPGPNRTTDTSRFDGYARVAAYADGTERRHTDFPAFDRATVTEVNLFTTCDSFDFDRLSRILDELFRSLPALKRVFDHPVIHLRDEEELLPVEAVRVVNNRTMLHAGSHSELWDDASNGCVRPRKLLTRTGSDEYALFENIGFTKLILQTEAFLRCNMHAVRAFLYTDDILNRNLLEKGSHLYYVLAIGKLRTGYIRGMEVYRDTAKRCLRRMEYLYDALTVRMKSPVIRQCIRRTDSFTLHRSNLFRMNRDYQCVYRLLRFYAENGIGGRTVAEGAERPSEAGYFAFCEAIALFAAGHFSFLPEPPEQIIRFYDLNARFSCGPWHLRLSAEGAEPDSGRAVLLEMCRARSYRILLIPGGLPDTTDDAAYLRTVCPADEYVVADPEGGKGRLLLSLTDIESFRRVQQLLLRAMVYTAPSETADATDICPFCGHTTEPQQSLADGWFRDCPACRTRVAQLRCPITGLTYRTTGVCPPERRDGQRPDSRVCMPKACLGTAGSSDAERSMNFRNITPLTTDGRVVCPRCGQVHPLPDEWING